MLRLCWFRLARFGATRSDRSWWLDLAWVENFETEKNILKAMKCNALPLAKGLKRILLSIKADRYGVHLRFVWVYFLSFNFHLRLSSLIGSSCVFPFPSICSIVCSNERSLFVKQSKFYLSGHLLKTRWRIWLLFWRFSLSLSFFPLIFCWIWGFGFGLLFSISIFPAWNSNPVNRLTLFTFVVELAWI